MQTMLQAGFVAVEETEGSLIVGFADQQFDASQYFMLRRALDPKNDGGVYLEHTEQSYGTYAAVKACRLSEARIEVSVDAAAAEKLELPTEFAVDFTPGGASLEELSAGLQRIFAGTSCQLDLPKASG
jgi:hypothetical protein